VSNLVAEVLLRLAKVLAAAVLGGILYLVLSGPVGISGSAELALLSWIAAAVLILLVETSPV